MRRPFFETVADMKKFLFAALSLIVLLSLSACETAVLKSARESSAPPESEAGVLKNEGSGAEAALRDELGALEEPFGLIKGDKYYNLHLGLVFNLPEGWSFSDSSMFENDEASKDGKITYEMTALGDDGIKYIVLLLEDMRESDRSSYVSEKIYQKQILSDLTLFNSAYQKLSMGSLSFGAYKYTALYMKAPEDGLFESYFSLRYGNYMVNIICRDKLEKAGQALLEYFEEFE